MKTGYDGKLPVCIVPEDESKLGEIQWVRTYANERGTFAAKGSTIALVENASTLEYRLEFMLEVTLPESASKSVYGRAAMKHPFFKSLKEKIEARKASIRLTAQISAEDHYRIVKVFPAIDLTLCYAGRGAIVEFCENILSDTEEALREASSQGKAKKPAPATKREEAKEGAPILSGGKMPAFKRS